MRDRGCLKPGRLIVVFTAPTTHPSQVYNYWEPLHYLLYGTGMQTWEYSARFALRPYIYLLLHAPVAGAAGLAAGRAAAFYATRAALAAASAAAEAALITAAGVACGRRTALAALALALPCAGLFAAAPALLPSSFVMVCLTAASASWLHPSGSTTSVIGWAAIGLVWGWPVAGVAFVPAALGVLAAPRLPRSIAVAVAWAVATLAPLIVIDLVLYGKWTVSRVVCVWGGEGEKRKRMTPPVTFLPSCFHTHTHIQPHSPQVSLLNFILYNVAGGGDSALYGTEPWHYYPRNAFLNLGLCLPLAAALPVALALAGRSGRPRSTARLLAVTSAAPVWWAALTALPHKEERFLYPVHPLLTLAAGATVAAAPGVVRTVTPRALRRAVAPLARATPVLLITAAALLGVSRTLALTVNYSAPLRVYSGLPPSPPRAVPARVCLGAEWHRFPSSFLLPSTDYAPSFVASGFGGLLPVPFNASAGGTAAAPPTLNDRNQRAPSHALPDAAECAFYVGIAPPHGDAPSAGRAWRVAAEAPFVDATASSGGLLRAFYVPRLSPAAVPRATYVLMERVAPDVSGSARLAAASGGG